MVFMPLLFSRQPSTTLFLKASMIKDISIPLTCKLIKEWWYEVPGDQHTPAGPSGSCVD
jgi:hypothetical protein